MVEKETITFRVRPVEKESLDAEADDHGVSRSEYVRELIEKGREYEELHERLAAREERIETLEEQLAKRSQVEERVDELALELREGRAEPAAPWPVRWVEWWRSRDRLDE